MSRDDAHEKRSRKGAMQPTLTDVAREAGVAPITVSRYFNDPEALRDATRLKVEAAVNQVGYVRNMIAGSLASATTRVIPVIVPSLANVVFIEVIRGLQQRLEAAGYQLLLGKTDYDLDREAQLVRTFLGWSASGLIIAGLRHSDETRQLLENWNQPVVEIMEYGDGLDMNVGLDHRAAGHAMATHLLNRGYRHIHYAGAELERDYRAGERFEGHRQALEAAGLPAPLLDLPSRQQMDSGAEALMHIRTHSPTCDAIHFANDDMACGALLAAMRDGIRIPEDIAIAGFNGLPIGRHMTPRLTTIVSPRELIGQRAAEQLLRRIRGEPLGELSINVGFTLHEGESA
ncbi:LacI family DNA-binding transcriptional regulator [Larsenimonas rhizosphaerae]|uniref:LacI family DNA-binding transcriptional regulator n=1 Tax=Larsenimonas rhizosphaerae TaxID=2944682 RepID=A0AA41ZNE4_9GAMM|nr:LacI family DNA-binding transcriptional regulator [Larsenimonas rhizosphaerae]MCM2129444.1 LacI family DNA-binding transcriptional regulator [Larsenimonas rhizosphaerae]MCX2524100.1 LacI family DNA-binding transcriptional regulator [Larsenimonas rhizosphaerae]